MEERDIAVGGKSNMSDGQTENTLTLDEIVRTLMAGWKIFAVCLAIFITLGAVAAYLSYKSQTQYTPEGVWNVAYSPPFPRMLDSLSSDGSYDTNILKEANIEGAVIASGLDKLGVTASNVIPRLTVTDIPDPENAALLEVYYGGIAKANNAGDLPEFPVGPYVPQQYILTFKVDGPFLEAKDEITVFLNALVSEYERDTQDLYGKMEDIVEQEDYPLALYQLSRLLDAEPQAVDLQEQLLSVQREISLTKPTKDYDALITRLNNDISIAEQIYTVSRMQMDLIASFNNQSLPATFLSGIFRDKQAVFDKAVDAFHRQTYCRYLLEIYSEDPATHGSPQNIEKMFSQIIDNIISTPVVVESMSFTAAPQPSVDMSRIILILVGAFFIGLFIGLLIIFGKDSTAKNRSNLSL